MLWEKAIKPLALCESQPLYPIWGVIIKLVWEGKWILLAVVYFLGSQMLDVGQVVFFGGGDRALLTNGIWEFPALAAYHLGWYMDIVLFVGVLVYAHHLELELMKWRD